MDLSAGEGGKKSTNLFASYRERFHQELSTKELQFLLRVFGKTSARFFCFGIFVFGLNVILNRLLDDVQLLFMYSGLLVLVLLSLLPQYFMKRSYGKNPLSVSG